MSSPSDPAAGRRSPGSGREPGSPTLREALGLAGVAVAWMVMAAAWAVVAVVALLTVLRLAVWDTAAELLVWTDALGIVVALPVVVVALVALAARRWWLAGAALVVVVAQLALASPEWLAARPLPAWAGRATEVRVLDGNIDKSPVLHAGYGRAIERDHPDLVGFEEFTNSAYASAVDSGALRSLPYRCAAPRPGVTGLLLASRWPVSGCRVVTASTGGRHGDVMVGGTVRTPAGPVTVWVVHPIAPFPRLAPLWHAGLAAIGRAVRARGTGHLVVMGDFNATWGTQGLRALLADGLADAAAARGQALETTWPNGAVVPPFLRIDHVLTGRGLAVTRIVSHPGHGSDHRFLTATVAVHRGA